MQQEVRIVRALRNKDVPKGTVIGISTGKTPGKINILLKLPGQQEFRNLGDLPIVDGVVELPVPLVFLSYAHEDIDLVHKLAERLWQDGFLTWLDSKDLKPGDRWKTKIEEAIDNADKVLVFLSQASVGKIGYVQKELKLALEQQDLRPSGSVYIIPIRLDKCDPPSDLKAFQWMDFWTPGAYEKLKTALRD